MSYQASFQSPTWRDGMSGNPVVFLNYRTHKPTLVDDSSGILVECNVISGTLFPVTTTVCGIIVHD